MAGPILNRWGDVAQPQAPGKMDLIYLLVSRMAFTRRL